MRWAGLCEAAQQVRNRSDARVGRKGHHAGACRRECRRGPTERKRHRLAQHRTIRQRHRRSKREARSRVSPPGTNVESGARSIRSSTKWGLETRSVRWSVSRFGRTTKMGRFGVCGGDCALDVELALATVIEQTERCVAALLDLRNDEPGANCVNRSGWHENDIVWPPRLPHDQIRDRAVFHGFSQLLLREALLQAEGNLGSRSRTEDVPGLGLAVRQVPSTAHSASSGWTWMESGFAREQEA